MTWKKFTSKAIRVPFVEHGRSYKGWDCWGLVCCGYKDVLNITLPGWDNEYFSTHEFRKLSDLFNHGLAAIAVECSPMPGAVAIVRRRRLLIHAGIVVDNDMLIHAEENIGTVQEPLSQVHIEGFYEPKQ